MMIGAATASVQQVIGGWATDLADPTQADRRALTTACLTHITAGTPTVNAEATFTSMDTLGFTVNWTTTDATARENLYLALASAPTAATTEYVAPTQELIGAGGMIGRVYV